VTQPVAIDFDAVIGDIGPLWRAWTEDATRRYRVALDGGEDEADLDARLGNWRALAERFAEDHAPVYLRPDPEVNAALRRLKAGGTSIGAFTNAPGPLARVAAAQLGVTASLDALECGTGGLERLIERLGPETRVARSPGELAS
jgi:phosphoglycolate phosphatase-like HAD superfamily hydrolase